MLRALSTGVSGLRSHQTMMDVLSNDIANVNTLGYKAQRTSFKDTLFQTTSPAAAASAGSLAATNSQQIGLGTGVGSIQNLMSQGAITNTGNPLDVAIQGDGFFRLTNDGAAFTNVTYTRAGNFQTDDQGRLITPDGYFVIGYGVNAGPPIAPNTTAQVISVPTDAKAVSIDQTGLVKYVDSAGTTQYAGYITLAKFANAAGLDRLNGTRWTATVASGTETVDTPGNSGTGVVQSGTLELSNVDLAREFSDMILAQRGFQANSRTISTADEMLQTLVNLKR